MALEDWLTGKAAPSPLQLLQEPLLEQKGLRLYLKRDDLLHPAWGGNKWRKLRHNLLQARQQGLHTLVTFGGAYSNHIAATAAAAQAHGFRSIGYIRGETHEPLNPTLAAARSCGMELRYLSRDAYRLKTEPGFVQQLLTPLGPIYLIPEGGTNRWAMPGVAEAVAEIAIAWDYLCCPTGTGGTLAGLVAGAAGKGEVLGFAALKGADYLREEMETLLLEGTGSRFTNWQLLTQYHFGGYAKVKPELLTFMEAFTQQHRVPLEPIYTGKMLFGLYDLIRKDYFPRGSTIVAFHTGGLQGLAGLQEREVLKNED